MMENRRQEITSLFEYRDRIVKESTKNIFEHIEHVFKGIDVFLTNTDKTYASGNISWEDVQYIEDNDILVVFGVLGFNPGSTIDLGGKQIEVTESNADAFQRMVRIGIPLNLVTNENEEDIVKFLGTIQPKEESVESTNVKNLSSSLPIPQKSIDFDWEQLTDEQKKSLITNNVGEKSN